jgi:hypothetical protein
MAIYMKNNFCYHFCGYSYNSTLFSGNINDCRNLELQFTTYQFEWNYLYSGYSFNEKKAINFVRYSNY